MDINNNMEKQNIIIPLHYQPSLPYWTGYNPFPQTYFLTDSRISPPLPLLSSSSSDSSESSSPPLYQSYQVKPPIPSNFTEVHQAYANFQTAEGLYPHLMTEKELADHYPGTSTCMERVWHGVFEMLTAVFPDQFVLCPAYGQTPNKQDQVIKEDAKVRFKCSSCGKGWTSMKGKVAFYFNFDYQTRSGEIKFQLFGQRCNSCSAGEFEHAMWYAQEVVRVLKVVVYRIGQTMYAWPKPKVLRERRGGSPKEKHEKELCQACQQGICSAAV